MQSRIIIDKQGSVQFFSVRATVHSPDYEYVVMHRSDGPAEIKSDGSMRFMHQGLPVDSDMYFINIDGSIGNVGCKKRVSTRPAMPVSFQVDGLKLTVATGVMSLDLPPMHKWIDNETHMMTYPDGKIAYCIQPHSYYAVRHYHSTCHPTVMDVFGKTEFYFLGRSLEDMVSWRKAVREAAESAKAQCVHEKKATIL